MLGLRWDSTQSTERIQLGMSLLAKISLLARPKVADKHHSLTSCLVSLQSFFIPEGHRVALRDSVFYCGWIGYSLSHTAELRM